MRDLTDRDRAIALVKASVDRADDDTLRSMLCAAIGHAPLVQICMGEVSCCRCASRIGDTLMSTFNLKDTALLGHVCPTCRDVIDRMTPDQRFLLSKEAEAFIAEIQAVPVTELARLHAETERAAAETKQRRRKA